MKLQTRTNLNYIFFSAIIYIIVAGSFYLAVEYVIYREVDRRLLVEKGDFEHFVDRTGYWDASCYFVEDKIELHRVSASAPIGFADTLLLSRYDSEMVPFRQVTFDKAIGNALYRVSIRKSLIESNELLVIITVVMLIVLIGGLSLLYIFQQRTSKRLWQPFYAALASAKVFDVNRGQKMTLGRQDIYEFNELNSSLNKMTDKILHDYQSLREFTENASHEIQTPLALINSRVEGLIQDSEISSQHISWIQDIHESTMRLSKLNQALLLLTRIENGQFQDTERNDLKRMLEKRLSEMEEVFTLKSITVRCYLPAAMLVRIHPSLADILLSNLLNNAVKHNIAGGTIDISMSSSELTISNSGPALTVEPNKLFERFQKQNKSTGSLGLGLSIAKKICDISGLGLEYSYAGGLHVLRLTDASLTAK